MAIRVSEVKIIIDGDGKGAISEIQAVSQAEEQLGSSTEKAARKAEEGGKKHAQHGRALTELKSSIMGAVAGYVAFDTVLGQVKEAINLKGELEQNASSFNILMKGFGDGNKIMADAGEFARKYGYTQQEMSQAVIDSTQVIKASKQPIEDQLGALARLGAVNPAEGIKGAAFALKELISGDVTSLVERFNISRDAAYQMRDAIRSGQDPILVLDQMLNSMGASSEVLATRMQGTAGDINRMKMAAEDARIAFGELIAPAAAATMNALSSAMKEAAAQIQILVSSDTRIASLNQQIITGAKSYEQYAQNIQVVNDATMFWQSNLKLLTEAEYEVARGMMEVGVAANDAAAQAKEFGDLGREMEAMGADGGGAALVELLVELRAEFMGVKEAGGEFSDQMYEAIARFGDGQISLQELRQEILRLADAAYTGQGSMTGGDWGAEAMSQAVVVSDELKKQMLELAAAGAEAFDKLWATQGNFSTDLQDLESDHQQKIADIISGGSGGSNKVSATEKANKKVEELTRDTDQKLIDMEKETQEKLLDIDRQLADDMARIDEERVDSKRQAYQDMEAAVTQSLADMRAAQEANDLELVGADEKAMARLAAREQAEAAARQRAEAAAAEAREIAKNGDAQLAQEIYQIRQRSIQEQQRLDEEYYRRKQELASDPAALAELDRQYQEATDAIRGAEETQTQLAQAGAQQRTDADKAAVEEVKRNAEEQRVKVTAEAEAQRLKVIDEAQKQKDEILAKAREEADGLTGSHGKSVGERIAAEERAHRERLAKAGEAYQKEIEAQKAHLGQLLMNEVDVQAKIYGVAPAEAAKAKDAIAKEYGVQQTISSTTYLGMTEDIKAWASAGGTNIDGLTGKLTESGNAGVTAQQHMRDLKDQMNSEVIQAFLDGKISAEEFKAALESIPAKVSTILEIEERIKRMDDANADAARDHGADVPPQYARGTQSARGGPSVLAEGDHPELVETPDGRMMMVRQAGLYNVPAGSRVSPLQNLPSGGSLAAQSSGAGISISVSIDARGASGIDVARIKRELEQSIEATIKRVGKRADIIGRSS